VEQCWRIVDPIIARWANDDSGIPLSEAGSWGPREADELLARDGRRWHIA
jgi:glucose-6-phosphate 1-dehydrogenase